MASIVPSSQPFNLTLPVLSELTAKLDKQPQVTERAIAEDEPSSPEERVFTSSVVSGTTTIICDHTPVRSELHKEAVHLRGELQLHLRSVMKTGDDMLVKIRAIVEKLDTAVHEKNLAIEELEDVIIKRDQLRIQFETVSKEVSILRLRILEMSKARDRAEIELEGCKGLLLEKREECEELKRESQRLHIQITEITHTLLEYTSRLTDAEGKVRFYISEVSKLKIEIESLKVELKTSVELNLKLGKDVADAQFEHKDLKLQIERLRTELIAVNSRLSAITIELVNAKEEVRKAIIERDTAMMEREQAIKDRDVAIIIAEDAASKRDDAIRSRDQAIFAEQSTNAKWIRDAALLVDCQKSLTVIRKNLDIITIERNDAVRHSENFEHLRDEALENFREADAARHRLSRELTKAHKEKKEVEILIDLEIVKTRDVEYQRQLVIKEKEIIEVRLGETERERDTAIAKKAKVLEDYAEADRERDAAIKKYEDMEDKFQDADRDLKVAEKACEVARGNEKAAVFQAEILTGKLTKSQAAEAAVTKERDTANANLKSSIALVTETKKEVEAQKKIVTEKEKSLTEANNEINQLKAKYVGPAKEQNNVLIKNIFFGSSRITSPAVYQAVVDSWLKKEATFTATTTFLDNCNPNVGQSDTFAPRWMGIFYASRNKAGHLIDQLPVWYKESSTKEKFSPKGVLA